jgi:hypothetical protein
MNNPMSVTIGQCLENLPNKALKDQKISFKNKKRIQPSHKLLAMVEALFYQVAFSNLGR